MKNTLHFFYQLCLALWVGGMVNLAFIVAPLLFQHFDRDRASEVTALLFPPFFSYNLLLSALALVCFFLLARQGLPRFRLTLALLLVALGLNIGQKFILLPQAEALRAAVGSFENTPKEDPNRKAFGRLHGLSNGVSLLLLLDGVLLLALSGRYRTKS